MHRLWCLCRCLPGRSNSPGINGEKLRKKAADRFAGLLLFFDAGFYLMWDVADSDIMRLILICWDMGLMRSGGARYR